MLIQISKRRMESLLRAEELARELRFQIAGNQALRDDNLLADYCIAWLAVASTSRWTRPVKPVARHSQAIRQKVKQMDLSPPY